MSYEAIGRRMLWKCQVRRERQRLQLSLRALSQEIGISIAALSVIEHGGTPTLWNAYKLSARLGVAIESLWTPKGKL